MKEKVLLVIINGLHPIGVEKSRHSFAKKLKEISTYTLNGKTVVPSYSLSACLSLCQSVPPERHGVLTEEYCVAAMPIQGLVERVFKSGLSTAFYYSKYTLRDIVRGGSLCNSICLNEETNDACTRKLTDMAIEYIDEEQPELFLLQFADVERAGREFGWVSSMYVNYVDTQMDCLEKLYERCKDEYTIVIVSDHAGRKFKYGGDSDEETTVPFYFIGKDFEKGKELENCSILDIAPTVVKVLGVLPVKDWEGRAI